MRQRSVLALCLFIGIFSCGVSPSRAEENSEPEILPEERWQKFFVERIRFLRDRYNLDFWQYWQPKISFGVPEYVPADRWFGYDASYYSKTQEFSLHPRYKDTKNPNQKELSMIDHELGHALADALSRKVTGKSWMDFRDTNNISLPEQIGFNFLSEGLGTYFGNLIDNTNCKQFRDVLPEGKRDQRWSMNIAIHYDGGCFIVYPIIKQFGIRGLEYIVTHPLRVENGNVLAAAEIYQRNALWELTYGSPYTQGEPGWKRICSRQYYPTH